MMNSLPTRRLSPLALASTLLLGAGFFTSAQAQDHRDQLAQRTQKRLASLFKLAGNRTHDLQLSGAQKVKLQNIARKNAPLVKAIWSDSSLSQSQKLMRVRRLQNEASAVFTPKQKQKLELAKNEAMMKLFETATWVSSELKLTAPQQEKIQSIVWKNFRQGSGGGSFGALRGLIVDANNQIDGVLTPAQRIKWGVIRGTAQREFAKNARAWAEMSRV